MNRQEKMDQSQRDAYQTLLKELENMGKEAEPTRQEILKELKELEIDDERIDKLLEKKLVNRVHQAMQGVVYNLNTMHSRAGAQVPFSSVNFGTDTSPEGRMVIKKGRKTWGSKVLHGYGRNVE